MALLPMKWRSMASGLDRRSAPFFRFPYFDSTPATLDFVHSRGIVAFGADLWASDWENITHGEALKNLTDQLESSRRGIILLHDAQARTAAMMPALLRYLRESGYRIEHLVSAGPMQSKDQIAP
ncbi:hypothetical protein [Bradyrhizobium japonicum]|uniref:hypothetical protein n=1 Tax=Bradyrhizobium japonicum TaxID=375 RepID=UPI003221F62F